MWAGGTLFIKITLLLCAVLLWQVPTVIAGQISLEQVLKDADAQALALRIAEHELLAATAQIAEARSDYYPHLSARLGNEYVRVHGAAGNVVSVGDAILADSSSGYKHSLTLSAQYILYDFGRRSLNLEYSKGRQQLADYRRAAIRKDIRRQVIEIYGQALKLQQQTGVQRNRRQALLAIYRFSERLQLAGKYGREAVATVALELAAAGVAGQDLAVEFANTLDSMTFLTGREYSPATTVLSDVVAVSSFDRELYDVEQHPDILSAQQEIAQKEIELDLALRSRYPQLILSGSHRMFGSDQRRFDDSFSSLTSRDSRIVLLVDVPLFVGFRSLAQTARLQHELRSLELRKQNAVAAIQAEIRQRQRLYQNLTEQESARLERQALIDRQQQDLERMTEQQLLDQMGVWRQQIEWAQQEMELEMRRIDLAVQSLLLHQMLAVAR